MYESLLKKYEEVGKVQSVNGSIISVTGLPSVHLKELVVFEDDQMGMVFSMTRTSVQILSFAKQPVRIGMRVTRSGTFPAFKPDDHLLGRTISPIPKISESTEGNYLYEAVPSGISNRSFVNEQFHTGVMMVDMLVSLGKGQKELVIGDRKIGKTAFVRQSVISHAMSGGVCVYAAIAKQSSEIKRMENYFREVGILSNVILVLTQAADSAGEIYLAPFAAMAIAEYYRDQGKDVLVVFDDLSAHAATYREISLAAGRFPGRNAYPSDMFYVHASLLERGGNFEKGSITCLPIADTALGDISGYIHTNLMAITDGHLYFDMELYNAGQRPAVNPFLSVTRVGRQTQSKLGQEVSSRLISFLVQVKEIQELAHFGSGLSESNQKILNSGKRIYALLDQRDEDIIHVNLAYVLFAGVWGNVWAEKTLDELIEIKKKAVGKYYSQSRFRESIDHMVSESKNLNDLIARIVQTGELFQ